MDREIILVGVNHRTAPVEVREQLAFRGSALGPALRDLVELPGVAEGAIISTCNRVEVVACGSDPHAVAGVLPEFLARAHGLAAALLTPHLYTHIGREAVRHLFRVAASLDSMVVGEAQILGQLKDQYQLAASMGAAGRVLHRCFHKSFSVAKRVRTETGVAERAVSVGSVAVELARGIFDRLDGKTALLIGAGTMGELVARQLLSEGIGTILVANRTFDRAIELARELHGVPVPFERLDHALPQADLVIGAAGGDHPLLDAESVDRALRERRRVPMFLIDLAVPRSFATPINALDGAYLYDIDDLENVIEGNRGARTEEAAKAEGIVDAEVDVFWRWFGNLEVVPTVVALRQRVEALRHREVERHFAALPNATPAERTAVDRLTQALVKKILHGPLSALRDRGEGGTSSELATVRRLFGLDEPGDPDEQ